jgi:dCTP deaminase
MAFLGGLRIEAAKDELFEHGDCDEAQIQQSSYDLRLGEEYYLSGKKAPEKLSEKKQYLSLAPGQFAILTCHERLKLPKNVLGLITLRNKFKMQGLVNVSGFHVDPMFKGRLVFAVQNVGPNDIRLKWMDPTFTIFFADVQDGKPKDRRPRLGIELEDIQRLGGNSITLSKLQKDVDRLKLLIMVYGPFGVAAFIALIVALVKIFSGRG